MNYNIEPRLYYWLRTKTTSNAELGYIIQHGGEIIPIEVKAGSTGSLKSLHYFMAQKNCLKPLGLMQVSQVEWR